MMTTLGNKKNVKIFSFALAGVFIASVAAMAVVSMGDTANAAPTSDIGVVDQREVISSNGTLAMDYQQKLKSTADEMQKDFDAKSAGMSDAEKEKLFNDMQQQFNQKRTSIEKDMEDQVTSAVKSVASQKGLSLVVDKSAVLYGGTDITIINTAVLSLILLKFGNSRLVGAVNKSRACKAPFITVAVKKINKILHRVTRGNRCLHFSVVINSFIKLNTLAVIGNAVKCHCDSVRRLLRIGGIKTCGELNKVF